MQFVRKTRFCQFSTSTRISQKLKAGVALDIDGVLIRGGQVLHNTPIALNKLRDNGFPFIMLTNGGGVTEERKARELSQILGMEISPAQVVLSHSPMKRLLLDRPSLKTGHILTVGRDEVKEVALSYGFENPVLPDELLAWNNSAWPFRKITKGAYQPVDGSQIQFEAVLVVHDSRGWGRDIQLICDVLRSHEGRIGTLAPANSGQSQSVPLYFSNPDFIWATEFPLPRFAQGAFRMCLNTLYQQLTGHSIQITEQFGKPFNSTYRYASQVIDQLDGTNHVDGAKRPMYAVGDNVLSDIIGANSQGWTSLLVETGVYKPGDDIASMNLPSDLMDLFHQKDVSPLPTKIVEDIGEAVDYILSQEL